jgi:hypothetical protein
MGILYREACGCKQVSRMIDCIPVVASLRRRAYYPQDRWTSFPARNPPLPDQ